MFIRIPTLSLKSPRVTQIPEERGGGRDPTGAERHMTLAIHHGVHGNTVYLVKVTWRD